MVFGDSLGWVWAVGSDQTFGSKASNSFALASISSLRREHIISHSSLTIGSAMKEVCATSTSKSRT